MLQFEWSPPKSVQGEATLRGRSSGQLTLQEILDSSKRIPRCWLINPNLQGLIFLLFLLNPSSHLHLQKNSKNTSSSSCWIHTCLPWGNSPSQGTRKTCLRGIRYLGLLLGDTGRAVGPADANLGALWKMFIWGYLVTQGQVCPSPLQALFPKRRLAAGRQGGLPPGRFANDFTGWLRSGGLQADTNTHYTLQR